MMTQATTRIGIIGTGFGASVQVPGFRRIPGAEVVAICSGRRTRAEAAARDLNIPHAFDDYQSMIDQADLDLVSVASPVYLHHPMTMAALEAGCHVLCEKPMAMNVAEARAMYAQAETADVVHMIDHELRFNPTRRRMAELLAEGYVGQVYHADLRLVSGIRAAGRPWNWWSEQRKGGGALGASGSHQVDLLRWLLGEITAVSGQLETFVRERPDPASDSLRPVDSDDQFAFTARLASGAYAHVFVSYVAQHSSDNFFEIHGEKGSLVLDSAERLWGKQAGAEVPTELTVPEPLTGTPDLVQSVWGLSFVHLAEELIAAVREERELRHGATFSDGLRCQMILDAIRQSAHERRWVDVEATG